MSVTITDRSLNRANPDECRSSPNNRSPCNSRNPGNFTDKSSVRGVAEPGQLRALPRSEDSVEFMASSCQFHPQLADFILVLGFAVGGRELFDLLSISRSGFSNSR